MNSLPKVSIFGVEFAKLGMKETVAYLTQAIEGKKSHQVVTGNPVMIMAGMNDPAYMAVLQSSELVVPDGAGVVWAASLIGQPVAERVPGIELMHAMLTEGQSRGWKVYLLGAAPDVIALAAGNLQQQYPGIRIVGYRDGFFGDADDAEVVEDIRRAAPDLLFVGRSVEGQEPWLARHKADLGVPVMMGVGGSFDIISGKLKRAPAIFRRLGLEWLYRLLLQPWRYKRMLVLPQFAWRVVRSRKALRQENERPASRQDN